MVGSRSSPGPVPAWARPSPAGWLPTAPSIVANDVNADAAAAIAAEVGGEAQPFDVTDSVAFDAEVDKVVATPRPARHHDQQRRHRARRPTRRASST